jgi:hypothetical protein
MFEEMAANTMTMPCRSGPRAGAQVPLDTVDAPGAYVCNWNGHLLRISQRSLLPAGGSLALNIVGAEPLTVTRISENPDLPLSEARGLAWRFGLSVGF